MSNLTLTDDQKAAYQAFIGFIMKSDPNDDHCSFSLRGYAGTGKSTLVNRMLSELPKTLKAAALITQSTKEWDIVLTATTNKAAEALSQITNQEVKTIQSYLGLVLEVDERKRTQELVAGPRATTIQNTIIFIDEASFADDHLLGLIEEHTRNCKIVYIGDPAQLTPVKTSVAPVFQADYPTAALTQVVRQAEGNPIIDLATSFRNVVNGGPWEQIVLDNHHIQHMDRDSFEDTIIAEFNRPGWKHDCSKVLAWTNKTVIHYNHEIRAVVKGVPDLQEGDYAVCNKYVSFQRNNRKCSVKTDQTVLITAIDSARELGVEGWVVEMDHKHTAFLPANLGDKKHAIREARKNEEWAKVKTMEQHWIDLRAAFACTVNKSQGSTYDKVFIDLDDIGKCRSPNTVARLLYVAVSRARHHVYLTGDF